MVPGVFFPNIAQVYHCVRVSRYSKKVNNAVLYITSVAYDISDETSSPILLQFPVPDMMKGRQSFKKEVGGEKIERKGKSVETSKRNFTHMCGCRREEKNIAKQQA